MTLQADPVALDRASRLVEQIRESILDEQTKLRTDVDDLLTGRWSGQAADQFRGAWGQWCQGMSDVLAGLGLESAAIAVTKAELSGSDADADAAARRLHDRLGDGSGGRSA